MFVVGLEENLFPMAKAAQDAKDLEEERRLFYVGATRGEGAPLPHVRAQPLPLRQGRSRAVRSRFLDELDETVVRTETGGAFQARPDRFRAGRRRRGGRTVVRDEYSQESADPAERVYQRGGERPQATRPRRHQLRRTRPALLPAEPPRDGGTGAEAQTAPRPAPTRTDASGNPSARRARRHARRVRRRRRRRGEPRARRPRRARAASASGKVLALEGRGDQANVTVHFKDVGTKKLKLKFAKLTVIG